MNKTPRLSKSGIEYLDYMWGIWSGCHNWHNGICGGGNEFNCWAKSLATRFRKIYPNGFEPTYYHEAIDSPKHLKKPSRIGVGWVGEVIGYASPAVRIVICDAIKQCPQHTFLFLTKNPEKLCEWEFPDNCWVGVTATESDLFACAVNQLMNVKAKVKFVSIEPLLSWKKLDISTWLKQIDWVIIGAQTPYSQKTAPKIEWVREIVEACDKAGIPVFLKDNLNPMFAENDCTLFKESRDTLFAFKDFESGGKTRWHLRQEFPL